MKKIPKAAEARSLKPKPAKKRKKMPKRKANAKKDAIYLRTMPASGASGLRYDMDRPSEQEDHL